MSNPAFKAWMKQVDDAVQGTVGLSVHDLPDQPFMDWYQDEVPPKEAAADALAYAGWEG
jgi:hypothetical protein